MNRRALFTPCSILLFSFWLHLVMSPAAWATPDPTEQLRPFVDKIVGILTDESLQSEQMSGTRRAKVMEVAHERFDFEEMSKRVLGSQWRQLSGEERKRFVDLFTKLLEHAYIGKIEDYSRQKVVFKGQRIKDDRAQVETELVDKQLVLPVSYIMILKSDQWMAYDIVVEGVSLIRNYMEQFREIIRKNGYPSLVKQIEDKVHELETNMGKPATTDILVDDKQS
ncbi:MAG: ABC transporter substrate-binding protein [Desulfobulbus sp.]|nr:MAG: ABC transporter substrate-binding protein [Desulfobulbus sp.]